MTPSVNLVINWKLGGGGVPERVGVLAEFLTGTTDVLPANCRSDLLASLLCQCYQTSLEANAHRHTKVSEKGAF